MADGIGDLSFASTEWVDAAREVLEGAVKLHADGLAKLGTFAICEVAHNPPTYLHAGATLSWHAKFDGASVEVGAGELPADECDFRMEGDHSIISNLARIQYHDRDPSVVAAAQARLQKLSKWKVEGALPDNKALGAVLASLHDGMAGRTMPRFVFMTPEWVSSARHLLSARATSEKYAAGLKDVQFIFSEEFTDTPKYAFPDGSHGGFWVRCDHGQITVGAGALPEALQPADGLTLGMYTPIVPVGRTYNAVMSDAEKAEQEAYSAAAFRFDKVAMRAPVVQSSPSEKGPMPPELARMFMPLHDELSKRTSGELPSDYDPDIKDEWATPQGFDRSPDYDPSWVRYDKVDIYGEPLG